jgi:hypothetical protein
MTINTETFYPDTCQCVIALAGDDTANPVTYSGIQWYSMQVFNVFCQKTR